MPQRIDVTGLSPQAVQLIESLVGLLRESPRPQNGQHRRSIFDLIGQAPSLRTEESISRQIQEERDAWGER